MAQTQDLISVRDAAREIADLWATHQDGDDFQAFVEQATPTVKRLLARPDLLTMGFTLDTHRVRPRLIYSDNELTMVVGKEPTETVPIHDHGKWEMLGLYRGSIEHRLYERLDDDSVPGYAELREVDNRVLEHGDVVTVPPPPHDLHGFTALTDDSYLLAILPGWYEDVRSYFDFERKSYYKLRRPPV